MASIKKYLYITIIITIIIGVTLAFIIYDINTNEELDKRIKEELTCKFLVKYFLILLKGIHLKN